MFSMLVCVVGKQDSAGVELGEIVVCQFERPRATGIESNHVDGSREYSGNHKQLENVSDALTFKRMVLDWFSY